MNKQIEEDANHSICQNIRIHTTCMMLYSACATVSFVAMTYWFLENVHRNWLMFLLALSAFLVSLLSMAHRAYKFDSEISKIEEIQEF